jgi:DNA polymerase-3 subunit epsilon
MRLLTFDTETTGVDVENDRIVTAFLGLMDETGNWAMTEHLLINPGIDIPAGATAVHGITTEYARDNGQPSQDAIQTILDIIRVACMPAGAPLVIYNAPFDLSILHFEALRHGLTPLTAAELEQIVVIDPLVIDKGIDKYRKGSRKLVDAAAHYGVPVETNAHDAGADCLMTGRVALRLLQLPAIAGATNYANNNLQTRQRAWKAEQSASLQKYFRTKANPPQPDAVVDGGWPVQTNVQHTREAVAA